MSDSLAIAAVTATLRNLLFTGLGSEVPGTAVSTRPPDRVTAAGQDNRINLFLYQTALDPAWRNQDFPGRTAPGEDGRPPLPLNLYYLVTAYAENDDEIVSHRLLGRAMSVLHDHPVLGATEIKAALADSDLNLQVERVRITPHPFSLDEMSKLWTIFQTQYRISAAYQACVVLIESRLPTRAPVPVLGRGDSADTGVTAAPDAVLRLPALDALVIPGSQPSAVLGDTVQVTGHDLAAVLRVSLTHPLMTAPLEIAAGAVTATGFTVRLPAAPPTVPAGACGLAVLTGPAGQPDPGIGGPLLLIAPTIAAAAAARQADGSVTITMRCLPEIAIGQQVLLALGDRQLPLGRVDAATDHLEFAGLELLAGRYRMRLRVDGVDSHLINRGTTPPTFDPTQELTVA